MSRDYPSNNDDIIDSRDIIARIDELETAQDEGLYDEAEELATLRKLAEQCEGYGDWEYGETLIRDSYFETYAEELARDIGAVGGNDSRGWPNDCIDWEKAADELKVDYISVDFDGVEYWMRA